MGVAAREREERQRKERDDEGQGEGYALCCGPLFFVFCSDLSPLPHEIGKGQNKNMEVR